MRTKAGTVVFAGALFLGSSAQAGHDIEKVTVAGKEFAFAPDRITVEAGAEVIITFENEGSLSHNLTLLGLKAATETIQAGATAKLKVTPEEPGTYDFICTVPGHKEAGMHGELVVE